MKAAATWWSKVAMVVGVMAASFAVTTAVAPVETASASNSYGPGVGPQTPGTHWGGAYVLQGVPGYGYCIDPGAADPAQLATVTWTPTPYPGSAVFTDGEMAALSFFAEKYQGTGYDGYSIDETDAAIAQVAYASAGGVTPATRAAPTALVNTLEAWIETYAGPWSVSLTMSPASGSTFIGGQTYSGTLTVTSATGNGVGGLIFSAPPGGGPADGAVSTFKWLAASTNPDGQISFQWSIATPGSPTTFSADDIDLQGGAPGTAPPTYAPPAGSGGQVMLVSGVSEDLSTGFTGQVAPAPEQTGTLTIHKTVPDASYYGPGGAVFTVVNLTGVAVDTLTTESTGSTPDSKELPAAATGTPYTIIEATAPDGYGKIANQSILIDPGQNVVLSLTGTLEEPVAVAQLGAAKVDAETKRSLPGATFDFKFDPDNNGTYSVDLGSCTTGTSGVCQPPTENAPGGWLPGKYRITETAAPAGYWLDPASSVADTFVSPGASNIATVTFGDNVLGSLKLTKTGDDTAYLAVTGAVFRVTGPTPATTVVGTLTVGTTGTTNVLTGMQPGSYSVNEITAPVGYNLAPPFSVTVKVGHTTTEASVSDAAKPGLFTIEKTDSTTGDPLAGATFDTRFDADDDGTFSSDLGLCTTNVSGACGPTVNDGTGYLPGHYQVTEVSAPAGYLLPTPPPSIVLTVTSGTVVDFSFSDHRLVPASFTKMATGNVNATELSLAGAEIEVTGGTIFEGPVLATCTTGASGGCTTGSTLVAGGSYCWKEVASPAGLTNGASGCFIATDAQASQPITVTDAGLFVAIQARKVDATAPTTAVGGATFDLYRVGAGASTTAPPAGTPTEAGDTWVAQAVSSPDGLATFPLQLPGFAYCTVEQAAPPGYTLDPAPICTGVLDGSAAVPPPVTTITTADKETTVNLAVHKYNAASPSTGIPGALYDLYAQGNGPPSGHLNPPTGATVSIPGDTWWAQGTTTTDGALQFTVPTGYSWCVREVAAPIDYVLDAGLHCTGILWSTTPSRDLTVAVPETLASVTVYGHKYDAATPRTTVPDAMYELVGQGPLPPGWSASSNPNGYPVPGGDWYVGTTVTGMTGIASWTVPAGSSWCLHEVTSPPDYQLDMGWHCTGILTTASTPADETVALPEVPLPALAYTGGPPIWLAGAGLGLAFGGSATSLLTRRRRKKVS